MKQLDTGKAGAEHLKSLWLYRLPESTQVILAYADSESLQVLQNTDKIHEVHARSMVSKVPRVLQFGGITVSLATSQRSISTPARSWHQKPQLVGDIGGGSAERSSTPTNRL